MELEFVDHRRGSAEKYSWRPPFDWTVAYDNEHWWDEVRYYYITEPWFVQVLENGLEVARVEIDDAGGINPNYANVPSIGLERLEIQLFEVAKQKRSCGIGAQVVRALAARHRDRRLFAYSEGGDGFWTSVGWDRFDHPDGRHRGLFIQPAR